jgi:hypothetical protein
MLREVGHLLNRRLRKRAAVVLRGGQAAVEGNNNNNSSSSSRELRSVGSQQLEVLNCQRYQTP